MIRRLLARALVCVALLLAGSTGWAATPIDIFMVAGQSNAKGSPQADDALAYSPIPTPGTAYQYDVNDAISAGVDPIYTTDTGSAWPAFMQTYYVLTGHVVGVIGTAIGGSGQWGGQCVAPASPTNVNGCWDPAASPTNITAAVARVQAGLAAYVAAGFTPSFKGILWAQGEADASYVNVGQESGSDYSTSFDAMRVSLLATLGGKFYLSQMGTDDPDLLLAQPHYRVIRRQQIYSISGDPLNSLLAFDGAKFFPRGHSPDLQQFDVHYTQSGYNIMGATMAANIVRKGWIYQ